MTYLALLLRELVDVNYATKGSELTFEELDTNFKLIGDAIAALSIDTSAFDDYDPSFNYVGGETYYVAYGGNIWKFVSPIDKTGITPGTDNTVWELSSSGAFAHERNKDTALAQGTADEVTANEIRTFMDTHSVIGSSEVTDAPTIALLADDSNWTNNIYTGTAITTQNPGDYYISTTHDYKFFTLSGTVTARRIPFSLL